MIYVAMQRAYIEILLYLPMTYLKYMVAGEKPALGCLYALRPKKYNLGDYEKLCFFYKYSSFHSCCCDNVYLRKGTKNKTGWYIKVFVLMAMFWVVLWEKYCYHLLMEQYFCWKKLQSLKIISRSFWVGAPLYL